MIILYINKYYIIYVNTSQTVLVNQEAANASLQYTNITWYTKNGKGLLVTEYASWNQDEENTWLVPIMKNIHTEGLALVFIQLNCQTVHSELFFFRTWDICDVGCLNLCYLRCELKLYIFSKSCKQNKLFRQYFYWRVFFSCIHVKKRPPFPK